MIIRIADNNNQTILKLTSEEFFTLAVELLDHIDDTELINEYLGGAIVGGTAKYYLINETLEESINRYEEDSINTSNSVLKLLYNNCKSLLEKLKNITEEQAQWILKHFIEFHKCYAVFQPDFETTDILEKHKNWKMTMLKFENNHLLQ